MIFSLQGVLAHANTVEHWWSVSLVIGQLFLQYKL